MDVLMRRCARRRLDRAARGHRLRRQQPGHRDSAASRSTCRASRSAYDDIYLPLHGAHQAHNAAYALAAVEAFTGTKQLDPDLVREAFSQVTSPGRLEVVRRSPTVLLDAAHNPHGAEATVEAVQDAFTFSPLIGVVGVMADKDVEEMLRIFEPVMAEIVCTQNSTPRSMPAAELAEIAEDIFGAERVTVRRASTMRSSARCSWRTPPRATTTRSAAVACSSPARSSPSARPARCSGARRVMRGLCA